MHASLFQQIEKVLLPRLTESQAVYGQIFLQAEVAGCVLTEGIGEEVALDPVQTRRDPVGVQVPVPVAPPGGGLLVGGIPWVPTGEYGPSYYFAVSTGDVAANGVSPVAVDAAPSICSKSTGLAGVFQCTAEWHHQCRSMPS